MLENFNSVLANTTQALKRYAKRAFAIRKTKTYRLRKKSRMSAAIISVSFIIGLVAFASNYSIGYTVKVDDKIVGTVPTKTEYYEVLDEVKSEVETISNIEFTTKASEEFSVEIISKDNFTGKKELAENLKSTSEEMEEAHVITADGEFIVALFNEEDAHKLVDNYLEDFDADENVTVSYDPEVLIELSYAPRGEIIDFETAERKFSLGECFKHTVVAEETVTSIAEQYGITEEKLLKDNGVTEICEGMVLSVYTGNPIIPIKTVEYINGEIDIPFEITETEDNTVYEGQTKILTKGVDGKKFLHAYITRVNGIITQENIIESEIISEPVTQVQVRGTKTPPPSHGTGEFIMPTSGRLSSTYGRRWGRTHAGIDLAAATGTPIYAADNGIVVESEYQSNGYGNIIKIDHQNGFVTYYAHCSALYVKAGDVVAKGDKIAAIGNTGRSTGPHLHFEIRKDGNHQNPFNFIK